MSVMSSEISHLNGWMECVCEHHVGQRTNQTISHNLHGEVTKQDMMNDHTHRLNRNVETHFLHNDMYCKKRYRNKRDIIR